MILNDYYSAESNYGQNISDILCGIKEVLHREDNVEILDFEDGMSMTCAEFVKKYTKQDFATEKYFIKMLLNLEYYKYDLVTAINYGWIFEYFNGKDINYTLNDHIKYIFFNTWYNHIRVRGNEEGFLHEFVFYKLIPRIDIAINDYNNYKNTEFKIGDYIKFDKYNDMVYKILDLSISHIITDKGRYIKYDENISKAPNELVEICLKYEQLEQELDRSFQRELGQLKI